MNARRRWLPLLLLPLLAGCEVRAVKDDGTVYTLRCGFVQAEPEGEAKEEAKEEVRP